MQLNFENINNEVGNGNYPDLIHFSNTQDTPARWASHSAGHIANKDIEITNDNTHEEWYLYLDEWPQAPTREKGPSFAVEIYADEAIDIHPSEPDRGR